MQRYQTIYRQGSKTYYSHVWAENEAHAHSLLYLRNMGEQICPNPPPWRPIPRLSELYQQKRYVECAHGVCFLLSLVAYTQPRWEHQALLDNGLLHELLHKAQFGSFSQKKPAPQFKRQLRELEEAVPGYLSPDGLI